MRRCCGSGHRCGRRSRPTGPWLRLRSELERSAADWSQGQRDESYLLRGGRLAAIDQWAASHPDQLGPLEQQFLHASRRLATRELDSDPPVQSSPARLARRAGGRCWSLALTAGGLAWTAEQPGPGADPPGAVPPAGQRGRTSWSDTRPDVAILAGLQSLSLARDQRPGPRATRPGSSPGWPGSPTRHDCSPATPARCARWRSARTGRLLATASDDRTVRLWDVATGQPARRTRSPATPAR